MNFKSNTLLLVKVKNVSFNSLCIKELNKKINIVNKVDEISNTMVADVFFLIFQTLNKLYLLFFYKESGKENADILQKSPSIDIVVTCLFYIHG